MQEYYAELGEDSNVRYTAEWVANDEDFLVRQGIAKESVNLGNTSDTEPVLQNLLVLLKNEDIFVRVRAIMELVDLGKKFRDITTSAVAQWVEQHQDAEYVGSGITALWYLVVRQS